ncbi:MAG: cytidylate kinase-like family protein [Salinivirgaceae bacterium]|jgi:cytidylate kinase|nr:cytidylate kinase-like family protein [Salinivirgaceae bacterium]
MDNILFKYFENRYNEASKKLSTPNKFGPVITISRQSGCEAKKIAMLLASELNKGDSSQKWRCIDKEILEKSAKELNLSISKIEHFYKGKEKSTFIDMLIAFSNTHVNDLKIKNTIKDVMVSLCKQGHIILVGRAGAAILQEKPNVLNIRLTAPFFWRIDHIIKNKKTHIEEAEEWAIETDKNRHKLFCLFLEKQPLNLDYLFDATLNRKHFNINQTVQIIFQLAKMKGLEL